MALFSLAYILFVVILAAIYYTTCRRHQKAVLLAASLLYYCICDRWSVLYLIANALVTYAGARILDHMQRTFRIYRKDPSLDRAALRQYKSHMQRRRRIVLWVCLAMHLLVLTRLKYWTDLFPGASAFLLPMGISFYTFMAISYLVDVYDNKYPAEKNFAWLLLFLSWFPQMLQGPIGRYDKMRPQFDVQHRADPDKIRRAVLLILFGLMKKYAIADMLSGDIANLFDGPVDGIPGSLVVFGILLYSIQQYADFSGGIDIIMGVSRLFGIELTPNFRQPYFSTSLGDFWRRWHISLGAFMRDYVFYPFALLKPMQRFGKWCTRKLGKHAGRVLPAGIANLVVFFIVGLWHGAQLHYILWGLYNGIVIALSDLTQPFWKNLGKMFHMKDESRGMHIFRMIRTFIIVNIGWYFDRIYDFKACMSCLRNTFLWFSAKDFVPAFKRELLSTSQSSMVLGGLALAAVGTVIVFIVSVMKEHRTDVAGHFLQAAAPQKAAVLLLLLFMILGSFTFTTSAGGFMYANF